MSIELAGVRLVNKPWGRKDLRPFARNKTGEPVGEICFTRAAEAPAPALLVKIQFTAEPIAIQVHPTDDHATSLGLPHGTAKAWAILDAAPGSKAAVGLRRALRPAALRTAIADGSIAGMIAWRPVAADDALEIPAGIIHAIGAGLVFAVVQQNSDVAFRLFDFGRGRTLHPDDAVATAEAGPAAPPTPPLRLGPTRTVLVANDRFVLERVVLAAHSAWSLDAERETWLLAVSGRADVGEVGIGPGQAVFIEAEQASLSVGADGLTALVAYAARSPHGALLREDRGGA